MSLFSLMRFAALSHTFSFSLSFSFSIFKFVDMAIILNLILWTTWIQKQSLLSIFVFIDSLVLSPGLIRGVYGGVWQKTLPFNETTTSFTSHRFKFYIFLQQNGFFASSFIFLCPIEKLVYFLIYHTYTNKLIDWIQNKLATKTRAKNSWYGLPHQLWSINERPYIVEASLPPP